MDPKTIHVLDTLLGELVKCKNLEMTEELAEKMGIDEYDFHKYFKKLINDGFAYSTERSLQPLFITAKGEAFFHNGGYKAHFEKLALEELKLQEIEALDRKQKESAISANRWNKVSIIINMFFTLITILVAIISGISFWDRILSFFRKISLTISVYPRVGMKGSIRSKISLHNLIS